MPCAAANATKKNTGTRAMEIQARARGVWSRGPPPVELLLDGLVGPDVLTMAEPPPTPPASRVGLETERAEGPVWSPCRSVAAQVVELAVDVGRLHPGAHEIPLEPADHALGSTEERGEPTRLDADDLQHVAGGQPWVGLGVDEVQVQLVVVLREVRDLVGERRRPPRRVEEVDAMRQLAGPGGAEPAQHRRDTDAARDPDLVLGAAREVEVPLRAADDGRHTGGDQLADARREVAERTHGDADLALL